jgi:hypothetical protein
MKLSDLRTADEIHEQDEDAAVDGEDDGAAEDEAAG